MRLPILGVLCPRRNQSPLEKFHAVLTVVRHNSNRLRGSNIVTGIISSGAGIVKPGKVSVKVSGSVLNVNRPHMLGPVDI